MSNLDLWNRVCKTDPRHVKPITGKQYSGNSPKPYYIVQRLTEEFGPCGTGWGFDIINERMERMSDTDILHIAQIEFWYGTEGAKFQQMGQTKAAYMTSKGTLLVDEDAPKKSVTDALVKCASYLGFAGDIFMGMWDDSKYVSELRKEFESKESGKSETEILLERSIAEAKAKREGELDERALDMIEAFREVDGSGHGAAVKLWQEDAFYRNNDERAYVWAQLRAESALRALLQANARGEIKKPNVQMVSPGPGLKKIGVRATTEETTQ